MDKNTKIRNYILDLLEEGRLREGDKLPGARQIAATLGCVLPRVQSVIESLTQCGILETITRSGTYVRRGWADRILSSNFSIYTRRWNFLDELKKMAASEIPEIRFCSRFNCGNVELKVTYYVLSHQDEYCDLSEIFQECFPDSGKFYVEAMRSFYVNGKLCGIPFIFSPDVILYNPQVFERAGCPLPADDWHWDDFLMTVERLLTVLPGSHVLNAFANIDSWINFIIRSGGKLFDPALLDPVCLDSQETIHALERYVQLREMLCMNDEAADYDWKFATGQAAMRLGFRQSISDIKKFNPDICLNAVALPRMNGCDLNMQGAELICFRRECTDWTMIKRVLQFMLSEKVQNFIGARYGGIPFLKSAAAKVMDVKNPVDAVLLNQIPKISTEYNIFSPETFKIVSLGIERICHLPHTQVKDELRDLANAIRVLRKIEQRMPQSRIPLNDATPKH